MGVSITPICGENTYQRKGNDDHSRKAKPGILVTALPHHHILGSPNRRANFWLWGGSVYHSCAAQESLSVRGEFAALFIASRLWMYPSADSLLPPGVHVFTTPNETIVGDKGRLGSAQPSGPRYVLRGMLSRSLASKSSIRDLRLHDLIIRDHGYQVVSV